MKKDILQLKKNPMLFQVIQRLYLNKLRISNRICIKMMNFHNNTALTKVLHTLQDNQNNSKESKQIYQSVLVKHFQIIQTFLQKINALYNKHEQFENSLATITQKLEKLDVNFKNIHNQFRTTHLMIDKRLNTIGADFNNIQQQLKNKQMEAPIESYLSSSHFLAQSSRLKARKRKQKRKQCTKDENFKVVVYSHVQINEVNQSMELEQGIKEKYAKNFIDLIGSCKTVVRQTKTVQFDGVSNDSSQNFQQPPSVNLYKKESVPLQNQYEQSQQQYQSQDGVDEQWVKERIENQVIKLSQLYQKKIKELQVTIQKNRQEVQDNYLKKQQFTQFQYQISPKINQTTEELRKSIQHQNFLLKEQVIDLSKQNNITLQTFQNRLIQKLDQNFFCQSLTNLNNALNQQFTKIERFYANKLQTKKALDFLEKKLNRFILQESNMKSKKNMAINEDPCLRINKCQSHKKIDLMSEKSLKDKCEKVDEGFQPLYKSLDTSMWQIQPQENSYNIIKEQKFNYKPMLSNINKLKNSNSSTIALQAKQKELSKVAKSLSAPKKQTRISLTITNAQPKVNIKEWREKVVKILRKQDIRKRKVTFR